MTQWKFMCGTAIMALVAGNAALADVTPEEVWENWKSLSTSYGQTLTTESEARDGDALIVTGLAITMGDDEADATVKIDEIVFTDNGDGSVDVTLSDSYPLMLHVPGTDGGADSLATIGISHPELVITASGSAEETRYDFSGPAIEISLDGIEGPETDEMDMQVAAQLTGVEGNYIVSGTTDRAVTSNFTAEGATVSIAGTNSQDGSTVDLTAEMAALSGLTSSKIVGDMADMAAALRAGTSIEGSYSYGPITYDMTVTDATGDMNIRGTVDGGDLSFAMNAARLAYGGSGKGVTITASGAQIPFPELKISYAESGFNMVIPVSKSDAPSDFALLTKIVDLSISDEIWGMFDPTGQLPHDPLTVVIDTKGTATLDVDLMDTAAMEALGDAAPGELNSFDINALQVKMVGAEVTGTGALTFDNSDLVSYEGMPAPEGKVELKAVGVNGLLDKLMAMGLIPEDQLMGARMMLGMFAQVDATAPDTMTSTLEFKDKGFYANGMQLK